MADPGGGRFGVLGESQEADASSRPRLPNSEIRIWRRTGQRFDCEVLNVPLGRGACDVPHGPAPRKVMGAGIPSSSCAGRRGDARCSRNRRRPPNATRRGFAFEAGFAVDVRRRVLTRTSSACTARRGRRTTRRGRASANARLAKGKKRAGHNAARARETNRGKGARERHRRTGERERSSAARGRGGGGRRGGGRGGGERAAPRRRRIS